ncbi:MAG: DUF3352 domain-containing protein [Tepidiformaceae bacterium]
MPGKSLGLAMTAGLVGIAAVVGGAILFTSGKASEVNLTSASLVPADAGFYFALNTDLTSSQWVNAFQLAERLGQEDPEGELKTGADDAGFDWEDDVAPFLGGDAAVFVSGVSISDTSATGAVILRCKDAKKALDVIDENGGLGDDAEYGGIEYYDVQGGFVAIIGNHLVIAFDEESMRAVIDVSKGEEKSLASVDDFQKLRDELTGNFLGFIYLSTENLLGDFFLDDPEVKAAIDNSGSGDLVFKPAAWVIGAKKDGFEFQAASLGEPGTISPMLAPRESKLIKFVPADAAFYFSTVDIAGTWEKISDAARDQIDDAIRDEGEYDSLDDAMRAAGKELGIGSLEEIIQLFEGETAAAFWFPSGDEDDAEGLVLAEVDQGKAEPLMEKLSNAAAVGKLDRTTIKGTEMTSFEDEDGDVTAYAFLDGNLLLGTKAAVEMVLKNDEPPLSSLRRYNDAVGQMPTKLGTYGYFNMSKLVRLAEGGVPADLGDFERALSGLIINVVDERGVARLSGILTVED